MSRPAPSPAHTAPALTPATASSRLKLATAPLMLLIGGFVSLQSLVNGELASRLGTGLRASVAAAVSSFGSGLVLLTLFVLLHPASRRQVATLGRGLREGTLPPWMVVGGLAGGVFVASQGITTPTLGVALFIVCVVAGQSVMALVVDHRGWGPGGHTPVSVPRLFGAVLAVVAALLVGLQAGLDPAGAGLGLLLALLPLVAGAGTSVQQGLNGRVAAQVGPWATTWNNFLVGTTGLLLFWLVTLALPGHLVAPPREWWLYTGGLFGIAFIALSTVMVRIHGVLVLGLWAVAGQVIAAVVIDLLVAPEELGVLSFVAAGLTLVGVVGAMTLRARGVR
ncbi:EamA-like transporter family protein [Auraticoccus sp. F435]|uniref:EamA-like transporter family protein n=1 Tax=Auraticoccus cholistanensis TaxID=2656650 RepID=A0A6A9V1P9_9ACTN|nr:EamA-like transporter family protein [Auraticoccus cholistanensis]